MVVEAFLVVTMAAFNLSIVTGCSGTDSFVYDSDPAAGNVKRMRSVRFPYVGEFRPIISLQDLRLIAKVSNRPFEKIYC